MQRWHGLDAVPTGWGQCVVTIGVFDGVHRGHAVMINETVQEAARRGVPSVLLTFVPHPAEVVRPGSHPAMLTSIVHRAELVEQLGVDVFCPLQFTREMSLLAPDEFVHRALVEKLHAVGVVVGDNFRFGHRAAGDLATLAGLGQSFGFTATGVELLRGPDAPISATAIRAMVAAGDVEGAAVALGRPYRLDGIVERGDQRGRELGFPTANLRTEQWAAVPADGVYAGRVVRLDEWGRTVPGGELGIAAISVGTNPTFEVRQRRVEAYILDFDGDLYGLGIGIEFDHRLRGMVKFDGPDALADLIAQMDDDVARTRRLMTDSED